MKVLPLMYWPNPETKFLSYCSGHGEKASPTLYCRTPSSTGLSPVFSDLLSCGRVAYRPVCGRYSFAAISRTSFLRIASAKVS